MPYKDPEKRKANAKARHAIRMEDPAYRVRYQAQDADLWRKRNGKAPPRTPEPAEDGTPWHLRDDLTRIDVVNTLTKEEQRERTAHRLKATQALWNKRHQDRLSVGARAYDRERKYNIPQWLSPWLDELMTPGNLCPACGTPFGHPGSTRGAVIDHDHDTGFVRMIVCSQCNTSRLRNFNDGRDPDALLLMAAKNLRPSRMRRAIIQVKLASLLLDHYRGVEHAAAVGRALSIPLP
jgi:hypothetical protein